MVSLYPLLLRPQFHERVWGSRDLKPVYGQEVAGSPIGEAWLTGDSCIVANGPLSGETLAQLVQKFGTDFAGEATVDFSRFPLLIKFLFPKDKLSVQVHPDDVAAASLGQPCGKTECWYIVQAEAGAQVGLGLQAGVTKSQVSNAIQETRMEELLKWVDVRAGDLIYVDAGTVHAIGPGVIIVETQQNSDTTYRLYDYGRPRELHVREGLTVLKENTHAGKVIAGDPQSGYGKTQANLVSSPCFIVDRFALDKPWEFRRPQQEHGKRSVWCLTAYQGCATVECSGATPFTWTTGEAVVVPASVERFTVKPQWEVEFLCASLPAEKVDHPQVS